MSNWFWTKFSLGAPDCIRSSTNILSGNQHIFDETEYYNFCSSFKRNSRRTKIWRKEITVVWTIVGLWNRNNSILPSSITTSTLFIVVNTGHNAKKMTSSFTNSRDNTARSLMVKTGSNCAIQSKLSYNNKKNLRPSDTRIYFSKHSVYFNPPVCCPRQNVCDVLHLSWIGTAG